jgi:hypothetical protein
MTDSALRNFAAFLAYCVAGYLCLVVIIWVFEQLPTWAFLAAGVVAGGVIVWRFGPDRDEELKLGADGHLHSTLFEMKVKR